MVLTTFHYICLFAVIFILGTIRTMIDRNETIRNQSLEANIIHKYLMTANQLENSTLPILWIHVPTEINSRQWLSYSERNSYNLNQPYLHTTLKSIISKCEQSFTICIINDNSFEKLLPSWTVNMSIASNPMLGYLRDLAMMKLLYKYGGLVCPISFLCLKNLDEMYNIGTNNNKTMFACEVPDIININNTFKRSMRFCGAPPNHERVGAFINYIEYEITEDTTSETEFNGRYDVWLSRGKNKTEITEIPGTLIGTQTLDKKPVLIDHLMSQQYLNLSPNTMGILIPANEILSRTAYSWFARISERDALTSNTIIGNYLLISSGECSNSSNNNNNSENVEIVTNPKWIPFWKIPTDAPVWGVS